MDHLYFFSKYMAGIYRESKVEIKAQFGKLGVHTTEGDILLFINDNPGISQREVAYKMVLDSGIVTRHMRSLEKKGFVTRVVDPADARRRVINLTAKGQKTVRGLQAILSQWWQELFAQAGVRDAEQTQADLARLYQVIIQKKKR